MATATAKQAKTGKTEPVKRTMVKAREAAAANRPLREAVAPYLSFIVGGSAPAQRGPRRSPERIERRLTVIDHLLTQPQTPIHRVVLVQERIDLRAELASAVPPANIAALEAGFISAAREYGEVKGITYAAWREVGVPPKVLAAAGIERA